MIYTKCLWTGQCQAQPGAVLFQMPHPSGAGRTRRPQSVYPPGPRWSRSHIRGKVPALHGRFHSRVSLSGSQGPVLTPQVHLSTSMGVLAPHQSPP